MRKFISLLLSVSIILGVFANTAMAYNLQSTSSYSVDEVDVANKLGFITEKQSYATMSAPINRLEAATISILVYKRLTGLNPKAQELTHFSDTYDENVNLAYELNIMSGRGDGTFAPSDSLTRQEMAKIFINILNACNTKIPNFDADKVLADFEDKSEIAPWAKDAMALLVTNSIIKGDSSNIMPLSYVTAEQAYIMAGRFYNTYAVDSKKSSFAKPDFAIPADYSWINEEDEFLSIGWTNDSVADKYVVYVYYLTSKNHSYNIRLETTNTFIQIPVFNFTKGSPYVIRIGAFYENGAYTVFSDPHIFNYGECWHPQITNKEDIENMTDFSEGITLNWATNDVELNCILTVTEDDTTVLETTVLDTDTYTFKNIKPGKTYVFNTHGINNDGEKTIAFDSVSVSIDEKASVPQTDTPSQTHGTDATVWSKMTYQEKFDYIFPTGKAFETEEEAKVCMTTINVPVWRLKADGSKASSTMSVTVHYRLAEVVYIIFTEIFNDEERFPLLDAGAYSWRSELVGGKTLSHHCYGTALDLNYNSNYCIYPDGSIVGDHWTPGEDPYSFPEDGIVVKTFEKYGFSWGGTWTNTKDYMHFSFLEQ